MDPEWYENKDVLTNLLTHVDLKTAGQLGKLNKVAAGVIADQELWMRKPIRYAVET